MDLRQFLSIIKKEYRERVRNEKAILATSQEAKYWTQSAGSAEENGFSVIWYFLCFLMGDTNCDAEIIHIYSKLCRPGWIGALRET